MLIQKTLLSGALLTFALSSAVSGAGTCSGARNLPVCAQFVVPFSTDSFALETSCGVTASSANMLIAQNIQINTGSCPLGFTATCCTSCIACGTTGIDCDGPQTALPPVNNGTGLPQGWSVNIPCAVDNANRIIKVTAVTYLPNTTPASCTAQCAAQGFKFAGVEFGDECYCGTGFQDNTIPPIANPNECNMACAGNSAVNCGGPWRMQIYSAQ